MNLSERQQKVLLTVSGCGEAGPSTIADRLEVSVSTAYRDLSVLEEHGLVQADESGKRLLSPLGKDVVEAIVSALEKAPADRESHYKSPRRVANYGEALDEIAGLMKAHELMAGIDMRDATEEDVFSLMVSQSAILMAVKVIASRALSSSLNEHKTEGVRIGRSEQVRIE